MLSPLPNEDDVDVDDVGLVDDNLNPRSCQAEEEEEEVEVAESTGFVLLINRNHQGSIECPLIRLSVLWGKPNTRRRIKFNCFFIRARGYLIPVNPSSHLRFSLLFVGLRTDGRDSSPEERVVVSVYRPVVNGGRERERDAKRLR